MSAPKPEEIPPEFKGDGCTGVVERYQWGDATEACRLHDWHYSTQSTLTDRREADRQLRADLIKAGFARIDAWMWYCGVRLGGWTRWKRR